MSKVSNKRVNCQSAAGIILFLLLMGQAIAHTIQSLAGIEQAAYEFVLMQAQESYDAPRVIIGKLDDRLRLASCQVPLHAFYKSGTVRAGQQVVGVRCDSPVAWTVYLSVQVQVMEQVAVATRSLSANHIITSQDIRWVERDIAQLRQGYIKNPAQLIGQQLKYPVVMGTIFSPRLIQPQKMVHRGQQITLIAKAGAMEVRMTGTAMADAGLGQRLRVKNSSSKRIVEGIVTAPGVVSVAM